MHGTKEFPRELGVLIRWDDLRMDGDRVFGRPCVNLNHPRGQRTVEEIENGFLNAASVGNIVALEISSNPEDYLPGQEGPTVSRWFNREASIVDIPGNYNALTDLVDANDNPLNLSDFNVKNITMKQIFLNPAQLALMNLKADAEQSAVDTAFADLVAKAAKVDGLINDLNAAKKDVTDAKKALDDLKSSISEEKVSETLKQAVAETRCTQAAADLLAKQYAGKPDELKSLVATMQPYQPIVKSLTVSDDGKVNGKTWDELDQAGGLESLKANDPEAFKTLYKQRWGAEYTGA